METKVIVKQFLLVMLFCSSTLVFAQNNYCYNQVGKSIDFPLKRADSLYIDYNDKNNPTYIKVVNPSKDTLYLFRSYLSQEFYSSKYLHKVDKKNKIYYVSFAPIVSNLVTKQTDKIILGENSIGQKGQILYDFIKLNPNTYFTLEINYNELFKNSIANKNAVKCYDNYSLSKFKEASFKTLTTSRLAGKYNLVFQFGIYTDIRVLCEASNYYLNEFEFDKKAKAFKTINVPVKLNNPNYPLFF